MSKKQYNTNRFSQTPTEEFMNPPVEDVIESVSDVVDTPVETVIEVEEPIKNVTQVKVICPHLNVRDAGSIDANVITIVNAGDILNVNENKLTMSPAGWTPVKVGKKVGFVMSDKVTSV